MHDYDTDKVTKNHSICKRRVMDKSDVSYDIMVKSENTLYKHINEKFIL